MDYTRQSLKKRCTMRNFICINNVPKKISVLRNDSEVKDVVTRSNTFFHYFTLFKIIITKLIQQTSEFYNLTSLDLYGIGIPFFLLFFCSSTILPPLDAFVSRR